MGTEEAVVEVWGPQPKPLPVEPRRHGALEAVTGGRACVPLEARGGQRRGCRPGPVSFHLCLSS